jgi:hypothetical protein
MEEYDTEKQGLIDLFKTRLEAAQEQIKGVVWEHHLVLKIPYEEQHFWSPQLTISFEAQEEGGVLVRGLFGPRTTVWMMFIFFYFLLGFIATIVMIMGFAQMNLGLSAGILWLLPVIGAIVLAMYLSAKAGQRMGQLEMERLYVFYHETITLALENQPENAPAHD